MRRQSKKKKLLAGFRVEWSLVLVPLGEEASLEMPSSEKTQTQMNLSIKYRESFRPFAPSVLERKSREYFDLDCSLPYMLLVAPGKRAN
jgi:predicted NodU family carbamoyl transferase